MAESNLHMSKVLYEKRSSVGELSKIYSEVGSNKVERSYDCNLYIIPGALYHLNSGPDGRLALREKKINYNPAQEK
jgi:hypothetical protein